MPPSAAADGDPPGRPHGAAPSADSDTTSGVGQDRGGPWRVRGLRGRRVVVGCLVAAAVCAVACGWFLTELPGGGDTGAETARRFGAARSWWDAAEPTATLPETIPYQDAAGTQQLVRVGLVGPAPCAQAVSAAALRAMGSSGCTGAVRGVYVDRSRTVVVTVAVVSRTAPPGTTEVAAEQASDPSAATTPVAVPSDGVVYRGGAVVLPSPSAVAAGAPMVPVGVASVRWEIAGTPLVVFATTSFEDGRTPDVLGEEGAASGAAELTATAAKTVADRVDDRLTSALG